MGRNDKGDVRVIGGTSLIFALVVTLLLLTMSPVFAVTPPDTCDPSEEGEEWVDPPVVWICECLADFGVVVCVWVPHALVVVDKSQEYNGTYGRTVLTHGLGSNPDIGVVMTHSRNSNGTTRFQGSGELRSRLIIQRWNGSSWANCVDTGYTYSTGAYSEWGVDFNMYTYADCGTGTYRVAAYGYMYDAGWRGGLDYTPGCWRD